MQTGVDVLAAASPAQAKRNKRLYDWAAVLIILTFFLSTTLTLKDYGLTWDEGLGNLFFGERYLNYLTQFKEHFIDFKADLSLHADELNLFYSPMRNSPQEFPPITDTLSAGSMYLFSYTLHWMDPVDAFHFLKILLAVIFLWFLYRFVQREWGSTAAIFTLLFLAFFPRFWGDIHFNPKDTPETIWIGLLIFSYADWLKRRTFWRAILAGLLFGAALATKANVVFVPFILVLGLWQFKLPAGSLRASVSLWLRDIWQYAVMGVAALGIYVGSWPYLYVGNNPVSGIRKYFDFISGQGGRSSGGQWNLQPLIQSLTTIPLWMLALLLLGIGLAVWMAFRQRNPRWRLALAWLIVPIVRISMPGMVNFDGIRHYMEYVPAAAILAGVAAQFLIFQFKQVKLQRIIAAAIAGGWVFSLVWIYVSLFPYLYIYYSPLIGGTAGARNYFGPNEVTDYWASSYRQGMEWIDQNAVQGARVYTPVADYLVDITAKIWLRSDLKVIHPDDLAAFQDEKAPVYVLLLYRPGYWNETAQYVQENYMPVKVFSVEGLPVLQVYQLLPGQAQLNSRSPLSWGCLLTCGSLPG